MGHIPRGAYPPGSDRSIVRAVPFFDPSVERPPVSKRGISSDELSVRRALAPIETVPDHSRRRTASLSSTVAPVIRAWA